MPDSEPKTPTSIEKSGMSRRDAIKVIGAGLATAFIPSSSVRHENPPIPQPAPKPLAQENSDSSPVNEQLIKSAEHAPVSIVVPEKQKDVTLDERVWRGYDEKGKIKLSDMVFEKLDNLVKLGITDELVKEVQGKYKESVDTWFTKAAQALDLPFSDFDRMIFQCIIMAESNFNPKAVSPAKAVGLTQLMPIAAIDSLQFIANAYKNNPEKCKNIWTIALKADPALANFKNPKDIEIESIDAYEVLPDNYMDPEVNVTLGAIQYLKLSREFGGDRSLMGFNKGMRFIKTAENKFWEVIRGGKDEIREGSKPTFVELMELGEKVGLSSDPKAEENNYIATVYAMAIKMYGTEFLSLQTTPQQPK